MRYAGELDQEKQTAIQGQNEPMNDAQRRSKEAEDGRGTVEGNRWENKATNEREKCGERERESESECQRAAGAEEEKREKMAGNKQRENRDGRWKREAEARPGLSGAAGISMERIHWRSER